MSIHRTGMVYAYLSQLISNILKLYIIIFSYEDPSEKSHEPSDNNFWQIKYVR